MNERIYKGTVSVDPTIQNYQSHYIEDEDGIPIGTQDMLSGIEGHNVVIIVIDLDREK